jgi:polygalacturonase
VLIESCTFDTGDDCIAIKSGRGQDGFVPGIASRFIVIRNCEMRRGVGGIAIGSEMSGGVNNVFAENIQMTDGRLARGLFIKSNTFRGGTAEHVHLRSVAIAGVQDNPIRLTYYYLNNPLGGPYQPFFRDINVSNLTCSRSGSHAIQIRGYPANKLGPVRLTDCTFTNAAQANPLLENVQGLTLTRVSINGRPI